MIVFLCILSACQEHKSFCQKQIDNEEHLIILESENDNIKEIEIFINYSLPFTKEKYLKDFERLITKENDYKLQEDKLTYYQKHLVEGCYSLSETIKELQKQYYYCHD